MGNSLFVVDFPSGSITATRLIAEGGFAFVYEATNSHGEKFAMKKVITPFSEKARARACKKEIAVLRSLPKHPNIVAFYDSECLVSETLHQKHFYLLQELGQCNVYDLMSQTGQNCLQEKDILSIFQDVCMAIHHIHSQQPPIAHRDIKIENILIGYDGKAKLCDFGSCSWKHCVPPDNVLEIGMLLDEIEEHTTLDIRAPEQIDIYTKHRISEKVDIWALGVVLFIMCTGKNPFATPSSGIVEKLGIVNCQICDPEIWKHSACLRDIVSLLLATDPEVRPSIFDVITHCMEQHQLGQLCMWTPIISNAAVWPSENASLWGDAEEGVAVDITNAELSTVNPEVERDVSSPGESPVGSSGSSIAMSPNTSERHVSESTRESQRRMAEKNGKTKPERNDSADDVWSVTV